MTFFVSDMQAETVLVHVAATVRIICSCAQRVGLCVNMTEGKTETVASRQVLSHLEVNEEGASGCHGSPCCAN